MVKEIQEVLVLFVQLVAIFICSIYLYVSLRKMKSGTVLVQYFCYLIFYAFFIVPIMLQIGFPQYEYRVFWKANEAMRDGWSNILYCIFAIFVAFFIMRSGKKDYYNEIQSLSINKLQINVCTIIIILCFVSTIVTNGVSILTGGYGVRFLTDVYSVNEVFIGCSVISYLTIIAQYRNVSKMRIALLTICIFLFFWIVGKRYIVAETMVMIVYVLAITKAISGKRLIRYISVGSVLLVAFAYIYGVAFKNNLESLLEYFTVDLSREYTLVYQFFCHKKGIDISTHQFDAIIYILFFWIPRSVWPEKPYPFVNSLTWSLISEHGISVNLTNLGWAATASIFSDLFDSFSFLGIAIGIYILVAIMQKCNRTSKTYYKVLLLYTAVRLMTVQISSAIVQIFICTVVFLICDLIGKDSKISYE